MKANLQVFGFDNTSKKAILVDGKINEEMSILSLTGEESVIQKAILAAAACPVNAFKVIDLSTQAETVTTDVKHEHIESIRAEYDDSNISF